MARDKQSNKCAHPACHCGTAAREKYCSEYCRDAKDYTELVCNCDHPACQ